jgi:transporter family-2 protein
MNPLVLAALIGAFVSGTLVAIQAPTNALLARGVGSPVNAALVSFAVGTVALLIVALASGVRPSGSGVRDLPWYAWTGGLYGAVFVAVAAFAAPRLGVTYFLMVAIAGQLAMALVLDRLGAFGIEKVEVSLTRVAGVPLVVGGAFLVAARANKKGGPAAGTSPFICGPDQRRSRSGATVMRTVSPELPGKPVNIASTRFGTSTGRSSERDRAWASPSNSDWPSAVRRMSMSR